MMSMWQCEWNLLWCPENHDEGTAGFAKREGYVVIKLETCSLFSCTLD